MQLTKTNLPQEWQALLEKFDTFTDVQTQAFELLEDGASVIATSPTGTGKTLAYLLPLLLKVDPKRGQQLLILAPNSELAGQIHEVALPYAESLGIKTNLIVSGASIKRQLERLKKGPQVIVATPGRALEFVKDKKIKMQAIDMVVLDEADHLLEPTQWGFVKQIVTRTPKTYQYAAFSATADRANEELQALITDAQIISIGAGESTVDHVYLEVENRKKIDTLRSLAHVDGMRALAFFNKLETLGGAEEKLQFKGVAAMSIASDVAGRFRKQLLTKFKDGDLVLLLATDIAARGIDIEGLEYVINFDVPVTQESYTHRVGRVGRMGRKGLVINLVGSPGELKRLKEYNPDVKPAKLSRGELSY